MNLFPCGSGAEELLVGSSITNNVPANNSIKIAQILNLKANHTYLICGSFQWTTNSSNQWTVTAWITNATQSIILAIQRNAYGFAGKGGECLACLYRPTVDDTVYLWAAQTSGSVQTTANKSLSAYQLD